MLIRLLLKSRFPNFKWYQWLGLYILIDLLLTPLLFPLIRWENNELHQILQRVPTK